MEVRDHGLYIAGKFVPASSNETVDILDPATNRSFARVASGSRDDVNAAVEAARVAFDSPDWRDLDPSKRGGLLWLLGQQVRDHFEELSRLESQNVGKPLREAKGDIAYVYKLFEYYAGLADKIQGETIPVPGARFDYTVREALGVTAHIAPWNYPLLLASRGVAPALAAGNAVVLKPATLTPLTALKLGELAGAAGFPPGIVNVVTGPGRDVGGALAAHPDVDAVTFTGSTDTGKQLLRVVAVRVVPTTPELGGKNPPLLLAGGGRVDAGELKDGNFVKPTVFEDAPAAARVTREEVFGPVVAAWRFDDLDDAIARANDTPYGLAAGVWTQDVAKAHAIARRLQAGMVSINEFPVTFPQTPFLGWKQSGLGQEQGVDAVLFYTHVKNVLVNLE